MRSGLRPQASGLGLAFAMWCTTASAGARVDWARGLVIAEGIGIADRHAPSPAVARGTARRPAEEAAERAIAEELAKLPIAHGGKLDAAVIAKLAAGAFALDAQPDTDGSWHVTMAVPIEAVRQAIAGPRTLPSGGDHDSPVIVVDGVTAKPAVGWIDAATVWVDQLPAYAKDAPHVKASEMKVTAGTLYVIARSK